MSWPYPPHDRNRRAALLLALVYALLLFGIALAYRLAPHTSSP